MRSLRGFNGSSGHKISDCNDKEKKVKKSTNKRNEISFSLEDISGPRLGGQTAFVPKHLQVYVSILTPLRSPRIPNNPIGNRTFHVVTGDENAVTQLRPASLHHDTSSIVLPRDSVNADGKRRPVIKIQHHFRFVSTDTFESVDASDDVRLTEAAPLIFRRVAIVLLALQPAGFENVVVGGGRGVTLATVAMRLAVDYLLHG